jgi:hypothetical protein
MKIGTFDYVQGFNKCANAVTKFSQQSAVFKQQSAVPLNA